MARRIVSAIAVEEWKLSEPPRRMTALPARRQSAPASAVTLGREFVNDADDAQRDAHSGDVEPVGPGPGREHGADGIGQRSHLLEPARHRLDTRAIEAEAVEHGGREIGGGGEIAGVGGEERGGIGAERGSGVAQRVGLARRLGAGEERGGGTRPGAQRAHVCGEVGHRSGREK